MRKVGLFLIAYESDICGLTLASLGTALQKVCNFDSVVPVN
jgi:hypothetical protein